MDMSKLVSIKRQPPMPKAGKGKKLPAKKSKPPVDMDESY